jgi:hypothetical protein
MKVLFRFWVVVSVLWWGWVAILRAGTEHFHNPADAKALAIMAAIPFGFLVLGYAIKWCLAGGKKHA